MSTEAYGGPHSRLQAVLRLARPAIEELLVPLEDPLAERVVERPVPHHVQAGGEQRGEERTVAAQLHGFVQGGGPVRAVHCKEHGERE
eukprot:CAMPEP_0198690740 /NCGR_PEP_ID=MMETSP1468-20131203/184704_1 /TAXON_ID=1461545 /ORGANISM="Mantoniella sp, Strain CCMP1436" /LENGTH=87 /DNA_ID=CAMNT_0044443293 /DNA_START=480 /DNA_END=740 /DNA_ORIENTATION=-